jgi:hypothetical protein
LLNEYNSYKKFLKKAITQAENNYYQNLLSSNTKNIKNTWKTLNALLSRNCNKNSKDIVLKIDRQIVSDPYTIATSFNKFFSDVTSTFAPLTLSANNQTDTPQNSLPNLVQSFMLIETTPHEVHKIMSSLKNSYSSGGYDSIPPIILKKIAHLTAAPISVFINFFINIGHFPKVLKHAKVIPIFKKGDKNDISNYRPISLLSSYSKIFEKIIHNQIQKYLEQFNLLHNSQYGFRKKRSTSDALIDTIAYIQQQLNNDLSCLTLLIDLKKAFDTVNHSLLIQKLFYLGIRGLPLQLIRSYLSDRTQSIHCNRSSSNPINTLTGVPQGSILGPLLYTIYVNDITKYIPNKCILFADDTTILIPFKTEKELTTKFAKCSLLLEKWLIDNKLFINLDKTCYLIFGKHTNITSSLNIFNTQININTNSKLLGLSIDTKFSWSTHITQLHKKLTVLKSLIYSIRDKLTVPSRYLIYHSLVESQINYCIELYGNTTNKALEPIILIQKSILKILFRLNYHHPSAQLFTQLKILPFQSLFLLQGLKIAHRYVHHNIYFFPPEITKKSSLKRLQHTIKLYHSSLGKKDCMFNIFYNWNLLNNEFKNIASISLFCKSVKKILSSSTSHCPSLLTRQSFP